MHISCPSRDVVSKGSTANGSLSSKAGQGDDCDLFCRGQSSRVAHGSTSPVHSPLSRVDSTVVQLASFPGG